ncbi:hypothetical protein MUN77_15280 [Leucobacter allii]|uniref:hypothetical protein n=1 Tax=Leucobacter allii TaxID=2932247 RepID=UPI001FD0E4B9|nr:hypothetical protein [Leucobacter allii]UOR01470.1 hypothetical protein MUN77_15280 [Leucobacter allii]
MHAGLEAPERAERAALLKERIYLTFAALAVVLTLGSHGHVEPGDAVVTLLVTVFGTLSAVFTADLISHIVAHGRLMTAAELRHAAVTTFGALGAVALPFVFLGISALGTWPVEHALRAAAAALVASLVAIGWIAVRRIPLSWWQRLVALGAEAALGLGVIALQLLAHG